MSLAERLDKIRSPKLQNQRETAVVLSAIEDTLHEQKQERSATGYFAALLALLNQISSAETGIANPELATSVVYLLDIVAAHVSAALLRTKLGAILSSLDPVLGQQTDVAAPIVRPAIGCIESVLIAQDSGAWAALPHTHATARHATAQLLALGLDARPKIRKRAHDALARVLLHPPPSPSLDHPAADLCASTALQRLAQIVHDSRRTGNTPPLLIHALQLVKTIALAARGWPANRLDALCEVLLDIARSSTEYLSLASFDVFEAVFAGMAHPASAAKIPGLLHVLLQLKPAPNDTQLLPPWIAVLSRGYDVAAQVSPEDTFAKLPDVFALVSAFLVSISHNIRVSASECLVSFCDNCLPPSVLLDPSIHDEKVLQKLGNAALDLLNIKYQSAWVQVFGVFSALFQALKWRASPMLDDVVRAVGELRSAESFAGKAEADAVIGNAVEAIGPEALLRLLPLNLAGSKDGKAGRVWLLPLLRDNIVNAPIAHFRSDLIPLSDAIQQRLTQLGKGEMTMEVKIYETVVAQIWSLLPGYCTIAPDIVQSFDVAFAELVSTMLYERPEMRVDLCKALQALVETTAEVAAIPADQTDLILQRQITQAMARASLEHLATMASSMLAVLFNIYSGTLPQYRGYILQCINAYLSIIPKPELDTSFSEVAKQLESELAKEAPQTQAAKQKAKAAADAMPPTSHALMDLIITMALHLPRTSFTTLWAMAQTVLPRASDPQLQKKAYKLIPRLEQSEAGIDALKLHNAELQSLLLQTVASATIPARRDRLAAFGTVVRHMSADDLHFIPAILSEVVIASKETNEKARSAAFDLLVLMGQKMNQGGTIDRTKIPHMDADAGTVEASLEEYITMLSAGLAGSTPHMISAGVTALARVAYEFHDELPQPALAGLVETMILLLDHNSREVVRAVLGFLKVAAVTFPEELLQPHLAQLVPSLVRWSHEQKARLRVKVKGILDRLIRRFSYDAVDKLCPEADKKLIVNIRKRRERAKRKKENAKAGAGAAEEDKDNNDESQQQDRHTGQFTSEYDRALEDSEDDDDSGSEMSFDAAGGVRGGTANGKDRSNLSDQDDDDDDMPGSRKSGPKKTYIIEDPDEPLDLLDRSAFGRLSSTKPSGAASASTRRKHKARTDEDGKLIFTNAPSSAPMDIDPAPSAGHDNGIGAIDAYVAAIRGRDAAQRGRGGRIKFKSVREGNGMDMDVDEEGDEDMQGSGSASTTRQKGRHAAPRGSERRGNQARFGAPRRGLDGPKDSTAGQGFAGSRPRHGAIAKARGAGPSRGRGRGLGRGGPSGRGASRGTGFAGRGGIAAGRGRGRARR